MIPEFAWFSAMVVGEKILLCFPLFSSVRENTSMSGLVPLAQDQDFQRGGDPHIYRENFIQKNKKLKTSWWYDGNVEGNVTKQLLCPQTAFISQSGVRSRNDWCRILLVGTSWILYFCGFGSKKRCLFFFFNLSPLGLPSLWCLGTSGSSGMSHKR